MKIKENKLLQTQSLNKLCDEYNIDPKSIQVLLESVKTKKMIRRNNYHQQTINDIIEKAIR